MEQESSDEYGLLEVSANILKLCALGLKLKKMQKKICKALGRGESGWTISCSQKSQEPGSVRG